jgi:hypothetical protein
LEGTQYCLNLQCFAALNIDALYAELSLHDKKDRADLCLFRYGIPLDKMFSGQRRCIPQQR